MTTANAQHLACLPPFESLLRSAYEHGELVLRVYHDGVFDEDEFLITGRLAILERQGLVTAFEPAAEVRPRPSDYLMRYELTPEGRRVVESAIIAEANQP